jgi:hypothetical protein
MQRVLDSIRSIWAGHRLGIALFTVATGIAVLASIPTAVVAGTEAEIADAARTAYSARKLKTYQFPYGADKPFLPSTPTSATLFSSKQQLPTPLCTCHTGKPTGSSGQQENIALKKVKLCSPTGTIWLARDVAIACHSRPNNPHSPACSRPKRP